MPCESAGYALLDSQGIASQSPKTAASTPRLRRPPWAVKRTCSGPTIDIPPGTYAGYVDRSYKGPPLPLPERHWLIMAGPPLVRTLLFLGLSSASIVDAFQTDDNLFGRSPWRSRQTLSLSKRASVPTTLPGNWTSLGCYTDNAGGVRTFTSAAYTDTSGMSVESCISFCSSQAKPFLYAGVEYAQECYCDTQFHGTNTNTSLSDCNMACKGNSNETCGAGNRLNVFWSGVSPPPAPATLPSTGNWTSLGCYNDTAANRALGVTMATQGSVSIESCTTACFNAGYPISGAEYSTECYCGNLLSNGATTTPLSDCSMPCAGNGTEFCGGPARLNVYNYTGPAGSLPTQKPTPPAGGGGGGGGVVSTTPVYTVSSGLPTGWAYNSCYVDNANGRIFSYQAPDNQNLTVELCVSQCDKLGYSISGVEYGVQCFCGNSLVNGAALATSGCNMGCGGNSTENCGGGARLSVYSSTSNFPIIPVPTLQNSSLPAQWAYSGCYVEQGATPLLPYQNTSSNNNVIDCINHCAAFGYPVSGVEYGQECFCGDFKDVKAGKGSFTTDNWCNEACTGDPIHTCGSGAHVQLYQYQGTLDNFDTPANPGYYEFLIGGLVVPLVATLGINNKVTFLEKDGTSEYANSTGAYELDLSLTDDYTRAWREMHVKSDVFCSAAMVLPDKAGRVINVGGWSLDSTMGIRLYAPDGSAGVNGTNDWEENFDEIHLQRQRWYPSSVLLTNGSILVVGGQIGSGGEPEPSLEVLPQVAGGPTWLFMDWLNRTDPNNLYPFLMILPSTNVFVGYFNEARILDPGSFDTLTVLPNMPGHVVMPGTGRSYPMEGSAVMLPQHAPYTDPVEILICGGATPIEADALDNCVSIAPEAPNATWTLERSPSKRVMPCMVALPDGTFLIVNGAHQGHAGFGLATSPNLQAELYDPTKPLHNRFSILNTTIVARLYHSEATLLPDGRVLISGSDPNPDTPLTGPFPEEMRIEVYIPPYLTQGFTAPTFSIDVTDWAYGGQYTISNVVLPQGGPIRISLIAATSSTHGAIMGGRTIFPDFSCSGGSCTITAPPNVGVCPSGWFQLFVLDGPMPSHSAWVRIGGDPGQLGNWPNLPGFNPPGM